MVPGIVGTILGIEAIKYLLEIGKPLTKFLMTY